MHTRWTVETRLVRIQAVTSPGEVGRVTEPGPGAGAGRESENTI